MRTELTKKISNVMGRAAVDMHVGPKAMEMLRYYAVDYEYMHGNKEGILDQEIRDFAPIFLSESDPLWAFSS